MFTYFHAYMPETWEAQVRAGLINDHGGIRFCQSIDIEERLKFNNLAAVGGDLHRLVAETRMPFYVDRLQGGCFIENYPYDMGLVDAYRELLGERFYGFQMHEWMSNYRSDLGKLTELTSADWNEASITSAILRKYPFPHVFLEAMNAREMANLGLPTGFEAFYRNAEWLFRDRQRFVRGDLLPCDSSYMAYRLELLNGARRIMPEIGNQTPNTRVQMAYARGMTKAYGAELGGYYEPWGGSPFSACCYHREGKNEWNIGSADFPFQTCGDNGGSSRSLQMRMQLYALFAGASFFSEEWGMCNTFYDWQDFELTPYGAVKRDFIRLTELYPDIGNPVTPVAVVLPDDIPFLDNDFSDSRSLAGYPVDDMLAEKLIRVRRGIRELFLSHDGHVGTENVSLVNGTLPDAMDIVHEGRFDPAAYEYLVDLTGSESFSGQYARRICAPRDVPALLDRLLPCSFDGAALKQITRRADGVYYLLLTNNSGVLRTVADGERTLPEADTVVTVAPKDGLSLTLSEGNGRLTRDGGRYLAEIPAGGWMMCRLA
jgi:hypothetical protein